jgi:hypothetical protein
MKAFLRWRKTMAVGKQHVVYNAELPRPKFVLLADGFKVQRGLNFTSQASLVIWCVVYHQPG